MSAPASLEKYDTFLEDTATQHHESLTDDPHQAAVDDNPEHAEKLTWAVALSALFLGTSFTGPIIFGFILVTPILVQLSSLIGGEDIEFWVPSGWGLAAALGFSIAGRLSDIFGRRYVILVGQVLTIVGGIVACTANRMTQLIAGEVILGASIGTVSVAYAGISEILPNKYRGAGLAWTEFNLASWVSECGSDFKSTTAVYRRKHESVKLTQSVLQGIPGTLLANVMISDATWRVMFWIAIGYGGFSLIGTFLVYFPPSHPRPDGKTKWEEFKDLDFLGAFLFTTGVTVFLFGLNSGGNQYPWNSAGTLAPLVLGLIVFLGAFIYDFVVPKDPLFPWYLFKNFREFSALPVLVFVVR